MAPAKESKASGPPVPGPPKPAAVRQVKRHYLRPKNFPLLERKHAFVKHLIEAHENTEGAEGWTESDDNELKQYTGARLYYGVDPQKQALCHHVLFQAMNKGPQYVTRAAVFFLRCIWHKDDYLDVLDKSIQDFGYAKSTGAGQHKSYRPRDTLPGWDKKHTSLTEKYLGIAVPPTPRAVRASRHQQNGSIAVPSGLNSPAYKRATAPSPTERFKREVLGMTNYNDEDENPRPAKRRAAVMSGALASREHPSKEETTVPLPDLANIALRQPAPSPNHTAELSAMGKRLDELCNENARLRAEVAALKTEVKDWLKAEQDTRKGLHAIRQDFTEVADEVLNLDALKTEQRETRRDLNETRAFIAQLAEKLGETGALGTATANAAD
jgi:hypothetical protein